MVISSPHFVSRFPVLLRGLNEDKDNDEEEGRDPFLDLRQSLTHQVKLASL